MHTDTRGAI